MGGARGRPVWRRGVGLATKVDDVRSNHPNLTLAHDSRKLRQFWGTVLVKYSWCVRTRRRSLCVAMDRAIDRGRIASASDAVEGGEEADPSRPSSRASSGGRVSPALESDMENIAWDELPLEKIYEYFAHATHLVGIVRAFEALKTKLGLDGVHGLRLFRSLKEKLSSQKTWKARDVLQMLDKRANQQEYMRQKAAEGVSVMIGKYTVVGSVSGCPELGTPIFCCPKVAGYVVSSRTKYRVKQHIPLSGAVPQQSLCT